MEFNSSQFGVKVDANKPQWAEAAADEPRKWKTGQICLRLQVLININECEF